MSALTVDPASTRSADGFPADVSLLRLSEHLEGWRRYQAEGEAGLEGRSKRPHRSPNRKVFEPEEALILKLRRERELGVKRLRNELARRHGLTNLPPLSLTHHAA
jgi:hypothetical protein